MRRRQFVLICSGSFILGLCGFVNAVHAQAAETYQGVLEFLKKLTQSVNILAADLDKSRLASYLRDLGNSLEEVLSAKRNLRNNLLSGSISQIESDAKVLRLSLKLAIVGLDQISFVLKDTLHDDGRIAANELSIAIRDRKGWVESLLKDVHSLTKGDRITYREFSGQSESSLEEAIDLIPPLIAKLEA